MFLVHQPILLFVNIFHLDLRHYSKKFEIVFLDQMLEVHNGNLEIMLLGMPSIGVGICSHLA